MEWYEYISCYDVARKVTMSSRRNIQTSEKWTAEMVNYYSAVSPNEAILLMIDEIWRIDRKPFYNVWPCIGEALANTSLDIDCKHIIEGQVNLSEKRRCHAVMLRWAKGSELDGKVRTCITCIRPQIDPKHISEIGKDDWLSNKITWEFWIRADAGDRNMDAPIYWDRNLRVIPGRSLSELQEEWDKPLRRSREFSTEESKIMQRIFKVAASIYLMAGSGSDEGILSSVVLSKDKDKYELSRDEKYVEKAKRRGIVGWDVGKHIEFSPHLRRPHFGLRWTGKGRKEPKIVPIKGCIVRRNKMTEVPTGYLDKEKAL